MRSSVLELVPIAAQPEAFRARYLQGADSDAATFAAHPAVVISGSTSVPTGFATPDPNRDGHVDATSIIPQGIRSSVPKLG
jgi:hypothetical protein